MKTWLVLAVATAAGVALRSAQEPVPKEWIDPDTGHRVVRLSEEPGSQSLYFHQNAYTPDGTKLSITTPTGLATIDLKTRAIEKVVDGRVVADHDREKDRTRVLRQRRNGVRGRSGTKRVARSRRSPLTARS